MTKALRSGRTTGTCASAAAKAGIVFLLSGTKLDTVTTPLPPGGSLDVPIDRIEPGKTGVRVTVIKDGGDDPDATHGCDIQAVVSIDRDNPGPLVVDIDGGRGVGRTTLPGLPVPVGKAAINPDPLRQIEAAVRQGADSMGTGRISVLVEVPEGEAIAKKTMNSRLGIIGGISILGTHGIVKPYSNESWQATIEEGLDVAKAQDIPRPTFTTGRRSERLYLKSHPEFPETGMIQAADFFEFAMQAAAERGYTVVDWSLFFGKLVKQAQGLPYTHAKSHPVDFDLLAEWCAEAGCSSVHGQDIRGANTTQQVLALLDNDPCRTALVDLLADKAAEKAYTFSGGRTTARYTVFDFDGTRLNSGAKD